MARFLSYLFSAGGFACLSLISLLWSMVRPRSTAARRALAAIVLFYAAASIRAVPWVLSRPLVSGVQPFTPGDSAGGSTAIVLLGAGAYTVHGRDLRLGLLDLSSAARTLEAAHVFRELESAWIVSSGGAAEGVDLQPSAAAMRDALVSLGVPADRVVLETESRTTRDEAVLIEPILKRRHPDVVVLVTSDTHMRRALAAFRAVGINPVAAPAVDPLIVQSRLLSFVPTPNGLRFSDAVAHEYAGLAYYALRGWLKF